MSESESRPQGVAQANMRDAVILYAIVVIAAALGNSSQTALNAMIPAVVADFGIGVDVGQWFTTGFMLTIGVSVPIVSYLIRRLGTRSFIFLSLGLVFVGSLIDLVSWDFWSMLFGRVVQGVSVGLLMSLMTTVAMINFPEGRRATAMGVAGIAMGVAPNFGPTLGGIMETAFGWRSFFVLLAGINVVLAILTALFVKKGAPGASAHFEAPSFVFSTLGAGGILLGLSQASTYGLASVWVWAPVAVGAVFLFLFIRRQARVEHPLMHLEIFSNRQYVMGLLSLTFLFLSFMGVTLVIPLYMVDLRGSTSMDAGMIMLPQTVVACFVNPLAGICTDKFGVRKVTLVTGALLVAGSVLWATVDVDTPVFLLMVYQMLRGIGVSGLIGPFQSWSLAKLPRRLVSDGSSATILIRQSVGSFGTALMVFAIHASMQLALSLGLPALPYQLAFGVSAVFAVFTYVHIVLKVRE